MTTLTSNHPLREQVETAIGRFPSLAGASWAPLSGGLINHTFAVETPSARFILQRLNPIFDARLHFNIEAVTARLASLGRVTPRLVRTDSGELWTELEAETGEMRAWRVLTRIDGVTHHNLNRSELAHAAGVLVGQFHRDMAELEHAFQGVRLGVHDTAAHLQKLNVALQQHADHSLYEAVRPLAERLLEAAAKLPALPPLPEAICHGDLKISNIIFARDSDAAVCLIDLDTLAPMPLAHELGDAWRSWCSSAAEDATEVQFDCALFEASYRGYVHGRGRVASAAEQQALLLGPELISLELAVRFCADALNESYFGWNEQRFTRAGKHNLVRAQGQYALYQAVVGVRNKRAAALAATR